MSDEIYIVDPVVFITPGGARVEPVGGGFGKFVTKLKKTIKKVQKVIDPISQTKLGKKIDKIAEPVGRAVASFYTFGLSDVAFTAADIAERKEMMKQLKAAAAKKDATTIKQIKTAYSNLKAESDKFRAERGLEPLPATLPDLKKAKPSEVEAAFAALQDDAAAIIAKEGGGNAASASGNLLDSSDKTRVVLYAAGGAAALLLVTYLIKRKRR